MYDILFGNPGGLEEVTYTITQSGGTYEERTGLVLEPVSGNAFDTDYDVIISLSNGCLYSYTFDRGSGQFNRAPNPIPYRVQSCDDRSRYYDVNFYGIVTSLTINRVYYLTGTGLTAGCYTLISPAVTYTVQVATSTSPIPNCETCATEYGTTTTTRAVATTTTTAAATTTTTTTVNLELTTTTTAAPTTTTTTRAAETTTTTRAAETTTTTRSSESIFFDIRSCDDPQLS